MTGCRRMELGKRVVCTAAVLLGMEWMAAGAAAETPEQIVRKLGSARFEERHAAERQILEVPEVIYEALKIQAESPQPEVQLRARRLLKVVQRQVLKRQFERFAATGDPQSAPAGWDRFSEIAGDSDEAVKLYMAMFLSYPEELTSLAGRKGDVGPMLLALIAELVPLQQDSRNFPVETLATALYLASSPDCPLDRLTLMQVTTLLSLPQVLAAVTSGEAQESLQRILGAYVQRKDAGPPEYRFRLAQRFSLDDYLSTAVEMVEAGAAMRIERNSTLVDAIFFIAEKGTLDNLIDLEPLLEDSTKHGDWRKDRTSPDKEPDHVKSQIRDAALLASIYLVRQSPADFGFVHLKPRAKFLYDPNTVGFSSDEAREAAFAKWTAWRQRNAGSLKMLSIEAVEGILL